MTREVEHPPVIELPITDTLGSIPAHNAEVLERERRQLSTQPEQRTPVMRRR